MHEIEETHTYDDLAEWMAFWKWKADEEKAAHEKAARAAKAKRR